MDDNRGPAGRVAREPVGIGVPPASSAVWKNTMATDHTDGAPPKRGSTSLVNIGCTMNKSEALSTTAAMNVMSKGRARAARCIGALIG